MGPAISRFGIRFKVVVMPKGSTTKIRIVPRERAGTPPGATPVTWKVFDPKVAGPSKSLSTGQSTWYPGHTLVFKIKALKPGRTLFTVSSPGARTGKIVLKVVPRAKMQPLIKVSLKGPDKPFRRGQITYLRPRLTPSGAVRSSGTWSSANPRVATVDQVGRVTAHRPGKATIRITVRGRTAHYTVIVR